MDFYRNRFFKKVDKTESCWLWLAGCDKNGFPIFYDGDKTVHARKYAWLLAGKQIKRGQHLFHKTDVCNNRMCVNPDHIILSKRSVLGSPI